MTFNDNASVGGNTARRRGGGIAVAGGGLAGIAALAVLLLNLFTGSDFSGIVPVDQGATGGGSAIENCQTGADANRSDDCRLAAASLAIDQYWAAHVKGYTQPQLIIVDSATSTQCGTASNQTGPFYCPLDKSVYVDPTFFALLRERFDATAGPLAQLYVLAHEYGHHVQNITGIMDEHPNEGTGPDSNGVRTELQADCFAGAWVGDMTEQKDANGVPFLEPPTQQQVLDALNATQAVGDDHIQQESGGAVHPESWTHGSSEQRQRWFEAGYSDGVNACDTFAVSGGDL